MYILISQIISIFYLIFACIFFLSRYSNVTVISCSLIAIYVPSVNLCSNSANHPLPASTTSDPKSCYSYNGSHNLNPHHPPSMVHPNSPHSQIAIPSVSPEFSECWRLEALTFVKKNILICYDQRALE